MRVALVHDWLVSRGGAEKVLFELHRMYPDAPIYTAAYDPAKFPEFADADVRPTWLNQVPYAKTKHQFFPMLRALAFWSVKLDYDVVISSCSAEAKYVRTGAQTVHICYCHTPVRYYWSDYDWYRKHPPFGRLNFLAQIALPLLIGPLRWFDFRRAQSVDVYLANSREVAKRIKRYYHRESEVVYPPIPTSELGKLKRQPEDFYLIVGRQVAYKRLDLAVAVFNELGLPLKVVGTGEEVDRQKPLSGANIEYLGFVDDAKRNQLFATAKGFIWPQEEDFGITAIEAMAAGCPVIGYGKGGALDYLTEGLTGTVFTEQTVQAVKAAIERFAASSYDEAKIRERAQEFDTAVFIKRMHEVVGKARK